AATPMVSLAPALRGEAPALHEGRAEAAEPQLVAERRLEVDRPDDLAGRGVEGAELAGLRDGEQAPGPGRGRAPRSPVARVHRVELHAPLLPAVARVEGERVLVLLVGLERAERVPGDDEAAASAADRVPPGLAQRHGRLAREDARHRRGAVVRRPEPPRPRA